MKTRTVTGRGAFLASRLTTVLATAAIFLNSMRDAAQSSAQSGAWLAFLQKNGVDWLWEGLLRKAGHFTEFAVLGLLLALCLLTRRRVCGHFNPALYLFLAVLLPLTDETVQYFAAGRSPQVSDVWIDIGGIAFAWMLTAGVLGIVHLCRRARRGHEAKKGPSCDA